jgi:hypothetical protein
VVPSAAYKGGARTSHYWLAAGGFDTMYTLWNPEPDAQELLVTLKYGANGATYKLPLTLESHASAMIDIGELIWTRQLDQNGNILPADVAQGSLVVSSPANVPEDAIEVVVGMGIYNPTKATCGGGCTCCGGMVSLYVDPFSDVLWYGDTQQYIFGYTDNSGWQYDVSNRSTWTSNASQVIGVQTAGQGSPGLANAVGVGPAEISAYDPIAVPINVGWVCMSGMAPFCPMTQIGSSAPVTVAPKPTIIAVTPNVVMAGSTNVQVTITGSGFGTAAAVNLPAGAAVVDNTQKTADQKITLSVNVSADAAFGTSSITVTANGATSNDADFTLDGPIYMSVVSDTWDYCTGCSTTVRRKVAYQIMNASGASSNAIPVCEAPLITNGPACTPAVPPPSFTACTSPYTAAGGQFTDTWSLNSDAYAPVGCGFSIADTWGWSPNVTVMRNFATLSGYVHTNAVNVNGFVVPPTSGEMPVGTNIHP